MGRPRASEKQRLWAYGLYRQGFKASAIHAQLEEDFGESNRWDELEDVVSLGTVKNWIRQFEGLGASATSLDEPFEWHRLEEYGLPWEAGEYLLGMWSFFKEGGVMRPTPPPSARQARWWWRVHLAALDIGMLDLWYLSQEFASRELVSDVLGKPLELEDLEARLAYQPWADDEKNQVYHRAIEEGRIPEMKKRQPILMESIQAGKQIAWSRESAFIGMAGGLADSIGCPELLHSQASAMVDEELALLRRESNEEKSSG